MRRSATVGCALAISARWTRVAAATCLAAPRS
ncbi:hypothetical protein [Erythrobacter sp.]